MIDITSLVGNSSGFPTTNPRPPGPPQRPFEDVLASHRASASAGESPESERSHISENAPPKDHVARSDARSADGRAAASRDEDGKERRTRTASDREAAELAAVATSVAEKRPPKSATAGAGDTESALANARPVAKKGIAPNEASGDARERLATAGGERTAAHASTGTEAPQKGVAAKSPAGSHHSDASGEVAQRSADGSGKAEQRSAKRTVGRPPEGVAPGRDDAPAPNATDVTPDGEQAAKIDAADGASKVADVARRREAETPDTPQGSRTVTDAPVESVAAIDAGARAASRRSEGATAQKATRGDRVRSVNGDGDHLKPGTVGTPDRARVRAERAQPVEAVHRSVEIDVELDRAPQGAERTGGGDLVALRGADGTEAPLHAPSGGRGEAAFATLARRLNGDLGSTIVRQAQVMLNDSGTAEIKLIIRPPELGRVRIQLQMDQGHIAGRILVDNGNVREVIQQNLPALERAFAEAGLELGSLEIDLGGAGQGRDDAHHAAGSEASHTRRTAGEFDRTSPRVVEYDWGERTINLVA